MKLLMIDNYDNFTYNIVQYLGELGAEVTVARNDIGRIAKIGIIKDQVLYVQAAAGIVADSVPELEWRETEAKARALLRAAELVEEGME